MSPPTQVADASEPPDAHHTLQCSEPFIRLAVSSVYNLPCDTTLNVTRSEEAELCSAICNMGPTVESMCKRASLQCDCALRDAAS